MVCGGVKLQGNPNFSPLEENDDTVSVEARSEEQGTKTNNLNAVLGARFGAGVLLGRSLQQLSCGPLRVTGSLPRSGELASRLLLHVRNSG